MGKIDWQALIKLAGPALASGGDAAFMRGFMGAQERARLAREQKAQAMQARTDQGAKFKLEMLADLLSMDDPVIFEQMKQGAAEAGASLFGMSPESWADVTFPESKSTRKYITELDGLLDRLQKSGHDLDELAASGSAVQTADGRTVPVGAAMDLTRRSPVSASRQRVPAPKKQPTATGTVSERAAKLRTEIRAAMDAGNGQEADRLQQQFNDLLESERALSEAGRKPVDPEIDTINKNLLQLREDAARAAAARGPGGPSDMQQFSMEERLARAWTVANQSIREMTRQHGLMTTGLKRFREGDKNGGSQAVLVTFQKILDPTSVVRESEYARTATGQSLLNRIEGYTERLAQGGAGMTDAELAAMVQTAKEMLDGMQGHTAGVRRRIDAQIKDKRLNPAAVFDDVLLGTEPPAAPAGGGPRVGERRTFPNGVGEWDGTGWKLVQP